MRIALSILAALIVFVLGAAAAVLAWNEPATPPPMSSVANVSMLSTSATCRHSRPSWLATAPSLSIAATREAAPAQLATVWHFAARGEGNNPKLKDIFHKAGLVDYWKSTAGRIVVGQRARTTSNAARRARSLAPPFFLALEFLSPALGRTA